MKQAAQALAAGGAAAAIMLVALGHSGSRAALAGLLVAVVAGVALAVPTAVAGRPAELPDVPQSSGFHPASLLADALARAAADPDGLRRVRPRLAALAAGALAQHGLDVGAALRGGLLSQRTVELLHLELSLEEARDDVPGRTLVSATDLRRCVEEVTALASQDPTAGPMEMNP